MAQKNAKAKHEKKKSVVSKLINKQTSTSQGFRIIGIGASAGGLEAMGSFFGNMPAETNMAFVVIQHLDPTHIGILPELLQRTTTMKVIQVTDQLKVKPNCVYVIPPNKSMSLLHGTLHLFEPVESRGLRLPIDLFFDRWLTTNSIKVLVSSYPAWAPMAASA